MKWQSEYAPFREKQIPEIMDLNVLPPFRNQGIGSALLETAERDSPTATWLDSAWVYMRDTAMPICFISREDIVPMGLELPLIINGLPTENRFSLTMI